MTVGFAGGPITPGEILAVTGVCISIVLLLLLKASQRRGPGRPSRLITDQERNVFEENREFLEELERVLRERS